MPIHRKSAHSVLIEPEEDFLGAQASDIGLENAPDESTLQMARELLALSGKGHLPGSRPLSRPRTFTPASSTVLPKNKRSCLVAISDDEDDRSANHRLDSPTSIKRSHDHTMTQDEPMTKKQALDVPLRRLPGGNPGNVPIGRPLAAPPCLPRLAAGELIAPPSRLANGNKTTSLGTSR